MAVGDVVRLKGKNWDRKCVVLEQINQRSYVVQTEDGGVYRRNRRDLLKVKEVYEPPRNPELVRWQDQVEREPEREQLPERELVDEQVADEQLVDELEGIEPEQEVAAPQVEPRRSGRARKPVEKLNLLVRASDLEELHRLVDAMEDKMSSEDEVTAPHSEIGEAQGTDLEELNRLVDAMEEEMEDDDEGSD